MTYFNVAQRPPPVHKARSKAGVREGGIETVLGGGGNEVRPLQQSDTAPVSWPDATNFWAKNYFDVARRSAAVHRARSKGGIREVALATVLGGSGNEVCRLQQTETALGS